MERQQTPLHIFRSAGAQQQQAGQQQTVGQLPVGTVARKADIGNSNAETRTFDVRWIAKSQVPRYDYLRERRYIEELSTDAGACRMATLESGNAPFLNNHNSYDVSAVMGVIQSATSPDKGGAATIRMSNRDGVTDIFNDIKDGILRQVSVGARVYKLLMIEPGAEGNKDWIYRAIDWEPYEISLVPIGADPDAVVRKDDVFQGCEIKVVRSIHNSNTNTNSGSDSMEVAQQTQTQAAEPENNVTRAVQTQPTPAQDQNILRERQRIADITEVVRSAGVADADALTRGFIDSGVSAETVRAEMFNRMVQRSAAAAVTQPQSTPRITTVQDETDVRRTAIQNALEHRINPAAQLTDAGRIYRGMSLREICRASLEAQGISTAGLDQREFTGIALGLVNRAGTPSDLPTIFGGVINRTLRRGYTNAPKTFTQWARKGTLSDFRDMNRAAFDAALKFETIAPGGEYKRGMLTEGKETLRLATYGKKVVVTRQMIINDDLDALSRLPVLMGRAAAEMEADIVYSCLTGNAPMADGIPLFDDQHKNVGTSAVISVASLSEGRKLLRTQTGPDGTVQNLTPKFLLVPAALETAAIQFCSSQLIAAKAIDTNPFNGILTPIVEARLDGKSSKAWYLLGDNEMLDTVEYCYLDGEEGLYTEQGIDPENDSMFVKARLDFVAKALDYRNMVMNAGG
ncbi:prohead protease/major capsid protein fusion protein [Undibacterium squillarum]|uniref:Prohead serine protease domain-containing protein n=1 Tax=Undibacterium squillarum TaxID=1131567 RepID=A0ABQ2Y4L1_9BURK|nr:prohead protease/major capsid protein fusion protein [Undibacterium squillarum]GGX53034.1 hypothetical protein GCM10010946_34530 [Undibacterium squillarum]